MAAPATYRLYELGKAFMAEVMRECPELAIEVAALVEKTKPYRAGPGFASVLWFGQKFEFTRTQGAAFKVLWDAFEQGTPEVHQKQILAEIESDSPRLSDIFTGHPAWKTVIVECELKGIYKLKTFS